MFEWLRAEGSKVLLELRSRCSCVKCLLCFRTTFVPTDGWKICDSAGRRVHAFDAGDGRQDSRSSEQGFAVAVRMLGWTGLGPTDGLLRA